MYLLAGVCVCVVYVQTEIVPAAIAAGARPQTPLCWPRGDADEFSHGSSAKRRKLLPPESSPPRVEDTVQDTVFIKPEPVMTSTRPAVLHRDEVSTRSTRGSTSVVGESPFASTKEMLEQMHWSDVSILKRLAETSVTFGTQVKELGTREARVARVDELVANAMRVLEFVKKMGATTYFGKDLNHMLVEIEKAVEIATDVLEECEHGDQEWKEQVVKLFRMVSSLDLHFCSMRTVLTRYEYQYLWLLLNESGGQ